MNKTLILFALFVTYLTPVFAQGDTTFFDKNWNKTIKDSAVYFRPKPTKYSKKLFLIKDYYISNGNLQMEATSLSVDEKELHGMCKRYYENGQIEGVSNYKKGSEYGLFTWYDSNIGAITHKFNYSNGFFHGDNYSYYLNGKIKRHEVYKNGKMLKGYCYTKEGKDTTYYFDRSWPVFPGGDNLYEPYVNNDSTYLAYISTHKKIGVKIYVLTYFDENGKIYKTEIEEPKYPELEEVAVNIIMNMPDWLPVINSEGKPEKSRRELDILFP